MSDTVANEMAPCRGSEVRLYGLESRGGRKGAAAHDVVNSTEETAHVKLGQHIIPVVATENALSAADEELARTASTVAQKPMLGLLPAEPCANRSVQVSDGQIQRAVSRATFRKMMRAAFVLNCTHQIG